MPLLFCWQPAHPTNSPIPITSILLLCSCVKSWWANLSLYSNCFYGFCFFLCIFFNS